MTFHDTLLEWAPSADAVPYGGDGLQHAFVVADEAQCDMAGAALRIAADPVRRGLRRAGEGGLAVADDGGGRAILALQIVVDARIAGVGGSVERNRQVDRA
ncbi:MAG: hypothetical protein OXI12_04015, partial [Gammaproteobacteria bacterium]|nr:hypothetical protein [Gammaproteobacteria bacterium]